MDEKNALIAAPVAKAASAMVAAAGSSLMNIPDASHWVIPNDFAGRVALVTSLLALIYTACLLSEWWWKKFWRPILEYYGVVKPRRYHRVRALEYADSEPEHYHQPHEEHKP